LGKKEVDLDLRGASTQTVGRFLLRTPLRIVYTRLGEIK
jgi:hypothetical protein